MLFIRRLLGRKKKERHPHAHENALPGPRALSGIAGLFDHTEKKITCRTAPLVSTGHVSSPSPTFFLWEERPYVTHRPVSPGQVLAGLCMEQDVRFL